MLVVEQRCTVAACMPQNTGSKSYNNWLVLEVEQSIAVSACTCMPQTQVLLDFSLSVKVSTLIFISGCGSAILSAKQGKSGSIYNLAKS